MVTTPQVRQISGSCATAFQLVADRATPKMTLDLIAGRAFYPVSTPTLRLGYLRLPVPSMDTWDDRQAMHLDCQDTATGALLTVTRPNGGYLPPMVARAFLDLF